MKINNNSVKSLMKNDKTKKKLMRENSEIDINDVQDKTVEIELFCVMHFFLCY